ncbi:hypothetical protein E2143_04825 [Oenococcus oeni]|uniref:Uncharacterized protein n=1 Tax=Oenococcus oeni TaxID=1247 RepID=A0AAJ2P361_OENOE|nr:hypothetical protein [Oenococcus oeni]MDV7715922.1 hypothetical protein [Oenococcus oeni]QGR01608.1 hypothetical protein E4R25_07035 [Oenococcus oeni]TEU23124.1 hypothetical protein E2147_04725 [Oenococcus oeni]TEU53594.1 hypothetical protein E2145_07120 [Oenococcus oeni]
MISVEIGIKAKLLFWSFFARRIVKSSVTFYREVNRLKLKKLKRKDDPSAPVQLIAPLVIAFNT